jgi:hypothetical protein
MTKTTKDRLYRTSDKLLAHREMIEKKLRDHEQTLFSSRRKLVLYDVTNTHFEGLCAGNPKAKHGKNKQKRNDCRQVAVGMAFDEQGNALAHEIFAGNMADTSTLKHILARLDHLDVGEKPVVILDAGFASANNIALLKERGYAYLINITRGSRTKYAADFAAKDFVPIPSRPAHQQVEVKTIANPDDPEQQLILCRSQQRRQKEIAMVSNAEARFLADATALHERIEKGRLKKPHLIEQKIGRLQKKHPRVNCFYTIERKETGLHIQRNDEKIEESLANGTPSAESCAPIASSARACPSKTDALSPFGNPATPMPSKPASTPPSASTGKPHIPPSVARSACSVFVVPPKMPLLAFKELRQKIRNLG